MPDATAPPGFPVARLASLTRRVKIATDAVQAVGGTVAAVEISPEGAVRVLTTDAPGLASAPAAANEWDEVLPH